MTLFDDVRARDRGLIPPSDVTFHVVYQHPNGRQVTSIGYQNRSSVDRLIEGLRQYPISDGTKPVAVVRVTPKAA